MRPVAAADAAEAHRKVCFGACPHQNVQNRSVFERTGLFFR
mgnify:FL=1